VKPNKNVNATEQAERARTIPSQVTRRKAPKLVRTWNRSFDTLQATAGCSDPFLAFPADVRRVVYTTNTIEALHRQIRKTIRTRGHFPTEEAARKLIYLSIINAQKSWRTTYNRSAALLWFKVHFGDRLP